MIQKRRTRHILLILSAVLICLAVLGGLFLMGVIRINIPAAQAYAVCGVDVSEYQGTIDWNRLAEQDIDFAFIKATEGSGYIDPRFSANWAGARETALCVGAYHFFSFDSPGSIQAGNFLAALPKDDPMLPPVVDIELYGAYKQSPPERETVQRELNNMLTTLEAETGRKPILYTTARARRLYLSEGYEGYSLWMREVYFVPGKGEWLFWQYSDRGLLEGYTGEEKYIDLNVFPGSREELAALVI